MKTKKQRPALNVSGAIRSYLTVNPTCSAAEMKNHLMEKYPTLKINPNSFSVGFYTARRKMGITARKDTHNAPLTNGLPSKIDLSSLLKAAQFLRDVGGADAAQEAIRQVQSVQIGG